MGGVRIVISQELELHRAGSVSIQNDTAWTLSLELAQLIDSLAAGRCYSLAALVFLF